MNQPDERSQAAQMAMVKLMSQPPETILNLFERLNISWQKVDFEDGPHLIVKWADLMEGEKRNQTAGPFIKKLVEEMKLELGSEVAKFNGQPPQRIPPAFKKVAPPPNKRTPKKGTR